MKKQKAPEPVADINVTPMVDVMLVLLIIFIVVTPMLSKGITVDMAKSNNPSAMQEADKEDAVLVAIARDGRTYLGTDQMNPDALPQRVKDMLTNKLDKTVYVRADARARYERVVEVVDNLRSAGVDQLGLLTEEIQKEQPGAATGAPAAPGT
ncbi:MAG TPA: biopolymer transporter ExbD [Bryobacteraceae bacterium]|nr:biopolymer transporter ExbD [Bryobacteraceae bacterium]